MLITITGKSGSGKSFISNYLTTLNQNIIHLNIDLVGHEALEHEEIKRKIMQQFNLSLNNNKIDRKVLGEIVFNNQDKMQELSNLTWQYMEQKIDEFININKNKIIILDWILIPKTKYFDSSNIKILVKADLEERIKRAIHRDSITTSKFEERERATLEFDEDKFDYVINNEEEEKTKVMVKKIYDKSIISGEF